MKQQVPTGLVVAIAAIVVLIVGFFGYRTLAGPSYPEVPTAKEQHTKAEQLAIKSGGDFSKLSAEDQKVLDGMTMGRGQRYVELNYQRLAQSGGK